MRGLHSPSDWCVREAYRDDIVLSFEAVIVSGTPHARPPEVVDIVFASRDSLPAELAFNTRIRVEDALERRREIVRVFDSADSLASSFESACTWPRLGLTRQCSQPLDRVQPQFRMINPHKFQAALDAIGGG